MGKRKRWEGEQVMEGGEKEEDRQHWESLSNSELDNNHRKLEKVLSSY